MRICSTGLACAGGCGDGVMRQVRGLFEAPEERVVVVKRAVADGLRRLMVSETARGGA